MNLWIPEFGVGVCIAAIYHRLVKAGEDARKGHRRDRLGEKRYSSLAVLLLRTRVVGLLTGSPGGVGERALRYGGTYPTSPFSQGRSC
jgi:hypothetical protein